ncbi:MAG TPA: hypothetical protein H9836_08775 [Candidatus Nocardiopsis merdipullorum]|nr:hypothetical protein [Candidatus Nocardiopsis merdipullorum]
MSENTGLSPFFVWFRRAFWVDDRPRPEPGKVRVFLDRYLWLFFLLALLLGFGCGLVAEFYIFQWDSHPAVSFWLFLMPSVLLGWVALRPGRGALVGLVALLAVTLGHFVGAQFTEYDQNNLEYRGWVFIAVVVGSFLGFLGHKIRSSRMITRALAASTPATLLCIPIYAWYTNVAYFADYFDPRMAAVDVGSALLLLLLCRGVVARAVAILCIPVLFYPLGLSLVITSPLLWYSGGGI